MKRKMYTAEMFSSKTEVRTVRRPKIAGKMVFMRTLWSTVWTKIGSVIIYVSQTQINVYQSTVKNS